MQQSNTCKHSQDQCTPLFRTMLSVVTACARLPGALVKSNCTNYKPNFPLTCLMHFEFGSRFDRQANCPIFPFGVVVGASGGRKNYMDKALCNNPTRVNTLRIKAHRFFELSFLLSQLASDKSRRWSLASCTDQTFLSTPRQLSVDAVLMKQQACPSKLSRLLAQKPRT